MSFKERILEENKSMPPLLGGAALGGLAGGMLGNEYDKELSDAYGNYIALPKLHGYDEEFEDLKNQVASTKDPEVAKMLGKGIINNRMGYFKDLLGSIKTSRDIYDNSPIIGGLGGAAAGVGLGAIGQKINQKLKNRK